MTTETIDTGEIEMTDEEFATSVAAVRTFFPPAGMPTCAGCPAPVLTGFAPNDGHTLVYCAACRAILDAQVDEP